MTAFDELDKAAVSVRAAYGSLAEELRLALADRATLSDTVVTLSGENVALRAEIERLTNPTPPPPPVGRKPMLPATGALFGATIDERPGETDAEALARMETQLGRKLAITHRFLNGTEWPAPTIEADVRAGRVPHLSIKLDSWANMASGAADAKIRQLAGRVKALGGGVLLSFHHEPTNDGSNSAQYVAAWKRFRSVLDAEGVDNALYIWVMIGYDLRAAANPDSWYPGNDVIDIVGADIYNWVPKPGASWQDLSKIIVNPVAFATKVGRPLFLCEWATNENPATTPSKAQWLRNARATIKANPIIKGVEYFHNEHTNADSGITNLWWWDSTPAALVAMKELTSDTYFRAMG